MGLIITLIVFVGLAAIIVWMADWTSGGERRSTALDTLNQRLARGEIDRAEYEEKRKLIGRVKLARLENGKLHPRQAGIRGVRYRVVNAMNGECRCAALRLPAKPPRPPPLAFARTIDS